MGFVFLSLLAEQFEIGKTEEELVHLQIPAMTFAYGFLFITAFLWINEFVWRWKEGKDLGDRIMPLFWLLAMNIYGAFYFSYRRMKELDPTPNYEY